MEEKTESLREDAVTSVTDAISRGRKRRSNRRNVATDEIQIGRTSNLTAEQLASRGGPSKRQRTSLILGEEEEEDDSNDEWEEHVDMDEDMVAAAVETLKSEKKAEQKETKDDKVGVVENGVEEEMDRESVIKARKQRARMRANALKKRCIVRHSVHILLSVAHLMRLDCAAGDEEVIGFAMSVVPEDTFLSDGEFGERLSRFALWLRATFRVSAMIQKRAEKDENGSRGRRVCCAVERAVACAAAGEGDVMDLVTVVAAIVRHQGFRCRIVSALLPVSHEVPKKQRYLNKATGKAKMVDARTMQEYDAVLYGWVEILAPDTNKWMPLDICEGCVNEAEPMVTIRESVSRIQCGKNEKRDTDEGDSARGSRTRTLRSRRRVKVKEQQEETPLRQVDPAFFAHVVAVENGIPTDVSRRYTRNWMEVEKARAKGRVFEQVLESLRGKDYEPVKDEAYKVEMAEFDGLAADEALPTSIAALQKHPRYILERHLKKYEVIHPKTPIVGYVKNEAIYLRSNLHLLHTRDRWVRKMRIVKNGAAPMKVVKSMNGTDDTVDLFGEWQTKPLIIPECINGKIPRGPHGNVDLWSPEHLPKGTVHINVPYAKVAARQVGIDFAPAMTGFEIRGGRSVPKIEGIVVAEEHGDMVRDAARATAWQAAERQNKRAREEACEKWLKLLRAVKAREQVKRKYGGMFEDVGTYEAMQKREGLRKAREEKQGKVESAKKEKESREKAERRAALMKRGQSHEHVFEQAQHVEGDTWVKTCELCGLDVQFEKL